MGSIRRLLHLGVSAGGAALVWLSVAGFTSPVPLPSISPNVPLPSPSVPAVQNLLQPSGGGQPAAGGSPAVAQSGPALRAGIGAVSQPPPASTEPNEIAPASTATMNASETLPVRQEPPAAATPLAGGLRGSSGLPLPVAPAGLAGLLLALVLVWFGRRPRPARKAPLRCAMRVAFSAPGAPAGAAEAAVRCLLQSGLPAETSVHALGGAAFQVEASIGDRAVLGACLREVAARGRRVGRRVDWSAEPIPQGREAAAPRARLALG